MYAMNIGNLVVVRGVVLDFFYVGKDGGSTHRCVTVEKMGGSGASRWIQGFDHSKDDYRTFTVANMVDLEEVVSAQ